MVKGFLLVLEVVKDKDTKDPNKRKSNRIQVMLISSGLIIGTLAMRTRNSSMLLFSPLLITSKDDVNQALEIFQSVITQIK